MAADERVQVTVVYSPAPRVVREWALSLVSGAKVSTALEASCLGTEFAGVDLAEASVGIWRRKVRLDQLLRDGDRIEVYRPLKVDPKLARRERFREQGSRAAGLFAGKRAGAKAGY